MLRRVPYVLRVSSMHRIPQTLYPCVRFSSSSANTPELPRPKKGALDTAIAIVKRTLITKALISAAVLLIGGIGIDLWYASYVEKTRERRIRAAFEKGSAPPPKNKTVVVFREKELSDIKRILETTEASERYSLITGEHGTGKTTLVLEACREVGAGCIYVSVPQKVSSFGVALAVAIGFEFNEHISLSRALHRKIFGTKVEEPKATRDPFATFDRVMPVLLNAAAEFKQNDRDKRNKQDENNKQHTGRPPVLVIDNINRLAVEAPKLLAELQDFAKDHADQSDIIVVFVSSEGSAPEFLQNRSSWSRARAPYEVGDITISKAEKYLTDCKVEADDAKKAVQELTGGRLNLLSEFVEEYKTAGKSYDEIKKSIFVKVRKELSQTGLNNSSSAQREFGCKVVAELLQSPTHSITCERFEKIVDIPAAREALLSHNFFSYHPSNDTVTFQSQAVLSYCKENPLP